jgi:Protein of unknown function (DUF3575)
MKNISFKALLFPALLLVINNGFAQSKRPKALPSQIVKIELIDFALSTFTGRFERVFSDRTSLQLSGSGTYQQVTLWDGLTGTFSGFAFSPEIRYYARPYFSIMAEPIAPVGIYAGIWGRYSRASLRVETEALKAEFLGGESYAGGLVFGWQCWLKFRKKPVCLMDMGVGGGYRYTDYSGRYAAKSRLIVFKQKGILPRLSLSIGLPL